jgi:hypothetical protein
MELAKSRVSGASEAYAPTDRAKEDLMNRKNAGVMHTIKKLPQ